MTPTTRRLPSIDAFRALTMLLMVFVNDLVLVNHPPVWLEHAEEGQDRLGLADTIFPAFLFIVGLSIPLAIRAARSRGQSQREVPGHILKRGFALLVMGFFMVNAEEYTTGAAVLPQFLWLLAACVAFFFIWAVFPSSWSSIRKRAVQSAGILLLIVLGLVYQGGTKDEPKGLELYWYGILGLIGWCYLICAILYWGVKDRVWVFVTGFVVFVLLAIGDNVTRIKDLLPYHEYWWFEDNAGLVAFTMAGVAVSLLYSRATAEGKAGSMLAGFGIAVPILLAAGFALRRIGGISKLDCTPSWVLICTAISLAVFCIMAFVVDIRGKEGWYRWIKPAGTVTLTCYLLSYMHFCLLQLVAIHHRLPMVLRTGTAGACKSLVFAFLIVLLTGWLEKKKIRLAV